MQPQLALKHESLLLLLLLFMCFMLIYRLILQSAQHENTNMDEIMDEFECFKLFMKMKNRSGLLSKLLNDSTGSAGSNKGAQHQPFSEQFFPGASKVFFSYKKEAGVLPLNCRNQINPSYLSSYVYCPLILMFHNKINQGAMHQANVKMVLWT